MKFIELVVAQGDKRGNPKRIKRSENLNRDNYFEEYFGEHPVSSILVSLLDIIFLMKNANQRSGTITLNFKKSMFYSSLLN